MQLAAQRFAGQWRVSQKRLQRPAVVAALLAPWDRESKITMKWWADDKAEGQKIRTAIVALHESFHADVVQPYLAAWRQYVYRLSIGLLTRARRAASDERRRLNSLNYGDLLNLTARVLRENVGVRRALQQKYRYLFVDEFQDTDPVQAEIVFWLAEATDVASTSSQGRIRQTGGRCRFAQGRSSSSATRSSRSTGSAAPTSTSTTSFASGSATKGVGRGPAADA